MIGFLDGSEGSCVAIRVRGSVSAEAFESMTRILREQMDRYGPLRLLIKLESCGPIEPPALARDFELACADARNIERIACA